MRRILAVVTGMFGLLCLTGTAAAASHSKCLMTLSASAANATSSRNGQKMTATADASGWCTFTLTACVNDTNVAGCPTAQVDNVKIIAGSRLNMSGLQQSLQTQVPTNQKACSQTTIKVGQTLHRKLRGIAITSDRRVGSDSLMLACQCGGSATPFTSTFDGIQKVIFDGHGCTNDGCHGSTTPQGGLQLTTGVSYQNIFEVQSMESHLNRVQPGDKDRSFLWLKLAKKTDPSLLPPGVEVPQQPMPYTLPAISKDELEALRLWIYSGAPQTGAVPGTENLLKACLPPPEPITIKPLDPPSADQGIQFVMPPWKLEAHSEHEICFATYYDITNKVPQVYRDPTETLFRFSAQELRQDPQSHHLILNRYIGSADMIHDPSFGSWACNGGERNGQPCEPTDLTSCGSGTCASEIQQSFACLGFGPPGDGLNPTYYAIGGAQTAQSSTDYVPGVFAQIPMKGILYWNSHAFNLTDEDTIMHARLNYYFASDQRFPVQGIFDTDQIFAPHAPPYATQTVCNDYKELPQGARLFNLSSHTHKHGKHFTVTAPDGSLIYENFVYNDPASVTFDPPIPFDSPDQAQRTLHYCSLYNNGVGQDGSPDPTTVTRRSRMPESAKNTTGLCSPLACAAGKVGARCRGFGDDRTCDSAPGANDGSCDACAITGGESTENEMFILIGDYYIDPAFAAPESRSVFDALNLDATGRSLSTDVVVPPQIGCSASHAGHAGHAAHHAH